MSLNPNHPHILGKTSSGWCFFANPLKNHGVRQLGWWNSQVNGKITCSKPPNSSFVYVQSLIRTISIGKIPDITRKFFYGQERTNFGTYRFLGSIFQSFLRCQENRYTARDDYCCSICLYISSIRGKQIMKTSPPVTGSPAALTPKPYNLHLMIIGIKHVKQ